MEKTSLEKLKKFSKLEEWINEYQGQISLCGFGLVGAGIETCRLLNTVSVSHVFLLGIAGSFDLKRYPVGSASLFSSVTLDGVGVGQGNDFASLPYSMVPSGTPLQSLILHDSKVDSLASLPTLLSVTSASANAAEKNWRKERYPNAVGEEMEGFAVALAAQQYKTPLTIIRGFSNEVGNRNIHSWQVDEALSSALDLLVSRKPVHSYSPQR